MRWEREMSTNPCESKMPTFEVSRHSLERKWSCFCALVWHARDLHIKGSTIDIKA